MARPGAGMDVDLTLNRRSLGLSDAGGVAARGELVTSVTEAFGIRVHPGAVAWDMPSGAQPVADSAFSVGGAASHGAGGARWGVWGSGDVSQFAVISTASGTSTSEVEGKATLTGSLVNVYPPSSRGWAPPVSAPSCGPVAESPWRLVTASSPGSGIRRTDRCPSAHAWRARLLVEAGLESRPHLHALLSGLVELVND